MCVDDVVRLGGGALERVQMFLCCHGKQAIEFQWLHHGHPPSLIIHDWNPLVIQACTTLSEHLNSTLVNVN